MTAKLIEMAEASALSHEITIAKDEFLVGRGSDCDLRLHDAAVSRHHCLLRLRGGDASVTDLGSSNGTFLNGQRVRSQAPLKNGDRLQVGEHTFLLQLGDQDPRNDIPDVSAAGTTLKLRDAGIMKKRSHPPGEAGGEGG
jgi:pSer/pThr/pTyr-binding forkhead associated (FHA) protein